MLALGIQLTRQELYVLIIQVYPERFVSLFSDYGVEQADVITEGIPDEMLEAELEGRIDETDLTLGRLRVIGDPSTSEYRYVGFPLEQQEYTELEPLIAEIREILNPYEGTWTPPGLLQLSD